MHKQNSDPGPLRNKSWLLSDRAQRTIHTSVEPARVIQEATRDISDNVNRALQIVNSDSDSDTELHPNIDNIRDYPFGEIDSSLIPALNNTVIKRPYISRTPSRVSEYSEFELTSYDSSIFDPNEIRNEGMPHKQKGEIDAAIDAEIIALKEQNQKGKTKEAKAGPSNEVGPTREEIMFDALQEIREQMAILSEYVHARNEETQEQIRELKYNPQYRNAETDVSYGRTNEDIRNRQSIAECRHMTPKHATSLIPIFDGTSRTNLKSFLSACSYTMKYIKPEFEGELLEAIMSTKLQGKALLDFEIKDIRNFDQLKRELEKFYCPKKNTTSIQIEFNYLKQRPSENAVEYGARTDKLAMELYEALTEGQENTSQEKRTILRTIQQQALQNFTHGLRDDLKIIVRAQRFETLQEAIEGARAEEKLKRPRDTAYSATKNSNNKLIQCYKCGKQGHYGRDCRTNRYGNQFNLPKPSGTKLNALDKFCNYCKKAGHDRAECWSLNGKPEQDKNKKFNDKPRGNTRNAINKINKKQETNDKEDSDGEEKDKETHGTTAKTVRERKVLTAEKIKQVNTKLDLISLPMHEVNNNKVNMLIDTGATMSLIKLSKLKDDAMIYNDKITIIGATGHKADTIGVIRATIPLKTRNVKHKIYVVKGDFPIEYDGILGADFLKKYQASWDYATRKMRIDNNLFTLFPCNKFILNARSEAIITAITNDNTVGIVYATEIKPGIFIGNCLVEPKNNKCLISIMNTTEKQIEIEAPVIEIEKIEVGKEAAILTARTAVSNKIPLSRTQQLREALRLDHLNDEERKMVLQICEEYSDAFHLKGEPLAATATVKHEIVTRADSAPANTRPYRLPERHKAEVNRQIQDMLADKIIQASSSQWNAPLLVVPKKTDASGKTKLRVVVDFRKLNDLTIGDSFPLPNITDILDQLGNSKYFTTLDLASGYHQIPMADKDKEKTAFSTSHGHFEFNRMPFGLKNAPATFQRLMNTVLTGLQGIKCLVYLDDIVIYSASLQEHNRRLKEVLQRIRFHNLRLQPDKCEFLRKEVTYLGHVITEAGIIPDPEKLKAVESFPSPQRIKDIQSFIGLAGYYRRFIKDFSKIAKPLTKLTKKGTKFEWTTEQQKAFDHLKEKLITAPILKYPNFNETFILTTDASDYALGAVLSQGVIGRDHPIAYASRVLSRAEQNYNTTERELLAIVWAVKHFRPYLYGTKFKIITDHKPLVWLFSVNDPGSRLIRWRLKLEEYDYEIIHKSGKYNTNADALSRNVAGKFFLLQEQDNKEIKEYSNEEKRKLLHEYHDAPIGGHQGIKRTIKRIRLTHNWKGLNKDVEAYINKCQSCQKNKLSRQIKAPLIITDTPNKPFEKCALDIVGPLTITNNGNKYILTFQDNLTKFSKAIPIPNQEANTVAKEFTTKIILEYGIPEKVLTDQGTNFMSDIFKNVCKFLKIEKIQTTAYHPQSNGALERSHRTLAEYLRHYISSDQMDWDEWVPYAMFTYNTTPHTATTYTPYELIYGHQATLPTSLNYPPKTNYTYDNYAMELKEKLRAAHQVAKENLKEEKIKAKTYYDKKARKNTFKTGNKVLLYDETLRRGRSKKLDALWTGPYTIIEKKSNVNYKIKKGRKTMLVHANRIKHFIES